MRPVEWQVDDITKVRLEGNFGDDPAIVIQQGEDDYVRLTSQDEAASLIQALLSAYDSAGWDRVELDAFGYEFSE